MALLSVDEPDDEEKLEELSQDGETPFRPADNDAPPPETPASAAPDATLPTEADTVVYPDVGGISDTHPQTDANMDDQAQYDGGTAAAAEAGEPNANDEVTGYRGAGEEAAKAENDIPEGFHETDEDEAETA